MSKTAIHLDNISLRFGSQALFTNLTLDIEDKKITAIQGRSGSGKSSLLQVINGLIQPDQGSVFHFGEQMNYHNIYKTRMNIGYAVQQVGLFPHLTVYENITLPGRLAHWTPEENDTRARELMALVSLDEHHKQKYPHQISGGEQQRVGICRSIFLNPRILLLDESFSSLDEETKEEIHTEVIKLQQMEPRCIVMVTHDPKEAGKLGDHRIKLDQGQLYHMQS